MSSDESNVFDPNKIDPSLEVHDIVTGGNGGNFAYAIAAPHNGKELTVFKFSAQDEDPICAARYTIALPSEVNVETAKFAAALHFGSRDTSRHCIRPDRLYCAVSSEPAILLLGFH